MDKQDEIILEENLNQIEIEPPKNSKKIKYAIAIIASTLVLATVSILLIGHFKFNWFKNGNYKLDINISRSTYQANYFSERKIATTKISLTDDKKEERIFYVDSNFVVYLMDKKKTRNGYLITASLVILDSKLSTDETKKDLAHFNIHDEAQIKEFESNPDGAKYPMAIFKFYEDGKIKDIQLPNTMDEYNAQTLIQLIKAIIPKLSRNKAKDFSKGLDIEVKKDNKKTILVERYGEGSEKQGKIVKTTIEDGQITNIETNSNMHLKAEPKEGEINFGPKDFSFDLKSDITANEVKYEQKENVELIKKLSKKYKLINAKELLESFKPKKEEEKKEVKPATRKLGFNVSASRTFNIASFNFLGQTISVKYVVSMSSSSVSNKVVVSSGLGSFSFGNDGISATISDRRSYSVTIFTFIFPNFPAVSVGCYASGSVSWEIGVQSGSGSSTKYYASLDGNISLGAEIKAGWDAIASLSAGAEGTVVSASGKVTISNGSVDRGSGFSIGFGRLSAYIRGCLFSAKIDIATVTIFNGWSSA